MIFVTIEIDMMNGKCYIRFCSEKECIVIELADRHMTSGPWLGGRINNEGLSELIQFLKENNQC